MNYYNEFDPKMAAWLRGLIEDKLIPNGYVDERSITEVRPLDLKGYTQCHFFCGLAGWPLSLQRAGWPSDRPIWTGSCPCQPFSVAGTGKGVDDHRHLAPVFLDLVGECRPPTVVGEQVASAAGRQWYAGIRAHLERMGYASGCADLCSPCAGEDAEGWIVRGDTAGWERIVMGSPNIRQRLYWVATDQRVADSEGFMWEQSGQLNGERPETNEEWSCNSSGVGKGSFDRLAQPCNQRARSESVPPCDEGGTTVDSGAAGLRQAHGTAGTSREHPRSTSGTVGLGDTHSPEKERLGSLGFPVEPEQETGRPGDAGCGSDDFFIFCADGKTRRTQSSIFPLVDGLPRGVVHDGDPCCPLYANATPEARVMRLHGYGNAINADLAAEFVRTVMDIL